MNFCETLKEVGNLCDGKKVNIEEAVAMFLIIICHNLCHRVVAERFQHSLRHRVPNYPKSSLQARHGHNPSKKSNKYTSSY